MRKLFFLNNPKKAISVLSLIVMLSFSLLSAGCGDSNITDFNNSGSANTSAGKNTGVNTKDWYNDSTRIQLDMSIKFKAESIVDSKFLESNLGNNFNHIVSFSIDLKPGAELDLQELQEAGIFGLYLSSNGLFTLSNSDGMAFSSKTVLMEKCSFIDLKVTNQELKTIKVTGLVAGE
jgi:hypothetical protein